RNCPGRAAVVDIDYPEDGHLRDAAHAMKSATRRAVDQPFIAHVAQQLLERDLVVAGQAEGTGNLALAGRLVRALDKLEDLLAGGKSGSDGLAGHLWTLRDRLGSGIIGRWRALRERAERSARNGGDDRRLIIIGGNRGHAENEIVDADPLGDIVARVSR